jgi:hypothetical protein
MVRNKDEWCGILPWFWEAFLSFSVVFAEGVWGGSKNRHRVHGDLKAANRKIKVIFQEKTT